MTLPPQTMGQYCTALSQGQAGDLEPIVAVEYVVPGNSASYHAEAIFDTGSAYSLAPSSLASSLGLNLNSGTPVTLTGVGGTSITAHVFHLTLNLGGSLQVANVPVAITDSTDQFLIGRLGFLGQVGVSIDPSGQTICFTAAGAASGTGTGCQGALDGDGDTDGDHCDETTGGSGGDGDDGGDTTDSNNEDNGQSGDQNSFQPLGGTSGGAFSGVPMLFVTIPLMGLALVAGRGIVSAPLKTKPKTSGRGGGNGRRQNRRRR